MRLWRSTLIKQTLTLSVQRPVKKRTIQIFLITSDQWGRGGPVCIRQRARLWNTNRGEPVKFGEEQSRSGVRVTFNSLFALDWFQFTGAFREVSWVNQLATVWTFEGRRKLLIGVVLYSRTRTVPRGVWARDLDAVWGNVAKLLAVEILSDIPFSGFLRANPLMK